MQKRHSYGFFWFGMKHLITIVTWNRLKLTKNTLRTFWQHNGKDHPILVVDNGSSDRTLKWLNKHRIEVIINKTNQGIYMATRTAWFEALNRGYEFIVNLQNDFPSIRPMPFNSLEKYMDDHKNIGFIMLNDKSRLMVHHSDGRISVKKRRRTRNFITHAKFKFGEFEKYDNLTIRTTNHHFSFNPNFIRSSLVPDLIGEINDPREHYIMEQFESLNLKCAKPALPYFETIIRPREEGWKR